MTDPDIRRRRVALTIAGLPMLSLAGCAGLPFVPLPPVHLARTVRRDGTGGGWVQVFPAEAGVRVYRRGQEIRALAGMALRAGDEIEVGPAGVAVVGWAGRGESLVDAGSRVRIGSLETLFGRVFTRIRGLFEVRGDQVAAAVSGTRFLFEQQRDRTVRVAVTDGAVTCSARNAAWSQLRLGARQQIVSPYPSRVRPRVTRFDDRDAVELDLWAEQVMAAPATAGCCDPAGPSGGDAPAPSDPGPSTG